MSTSFANVPLMVEWTPSSGQKEPQEKLLVGQSGKPQRIWANVEDRYVSKAGSQSSESEAHQSRDALMLLVWRNIGNCCSGVP